MADPVPTLVSLPIEDAKALLRLLTGPDYLLRECLVIATLPDLGPRSQANPILCLKQAIEEAQNG